MPRIRSGTRSCTNCGEDFTPLFDAQEQCCIAGFERKEVAGPPPPYPPAYTKMLARRDMRLGNTRYVPCPDCGGPMRPSSTRCRLCAGRARQGRRYAMTGNNAYLAKLRRTQTAESLLNTLKQMKQEGDSHARSS